MNIIEELRWRGMLHNVTPDLEAACEKGQLTGYLGIDPTASSLTIGNLAALMMLLHFQRAGHKPVVLVGGATGMVGDPSGKDKERNLLDEAALNANQDAYKVQLSKLMDFEGENAAIMVNNYDWFKNMDVLSFLRNIGKNLTVNYMMAKDSVKTRLESGISFTEFSYQLIQGYDFVHLYKEYGCNVQMGGSDQWGNITAGTELIRRMLGSEEQGHAFTCPLITKADGSKFGKSEGGNIWLAPELTSPYQFYQFWLNTSDTDAKKYIRIFTFMGKEEIEALEAEHDAAPHTRILQKRLAQEVTTMVHSAEDYDMAIQASTILFGKGTKDTLLALSERDFLSIFDGVPQYNMPKAELAAGVDMISLLAEKTQICASKGEARRSLQGNSISINKQKIQDLAHQLNADDLISGKYLLAQKGKKNYSLIIVND